MKFITKLNNDHNMNFHHTSVHDRKYSFIGFAADLHYVLQIDYIESNLDFTF